jgi:4-amino-4-deoxy-L-arabinose transferase-like glycosyltransferase
VLSTCNNQIRIQNREWVTDILALVIFLGVFYALWIGSHALFTPDEGRYSEVAREMVASGDYITPRLNGVAFLDKPVLYYWLQASAIQLFGLKEWALRFWPAALGILCAMMTYVSGRLLFNRRTGIIAALILTTSPLYYGGSHYANLDLEVASLIGDALLCFIAGIQSTSPRLKNILLYAAYIFAGLAALTKGLIGIVFPAMIIGAWVILLNRWNTLLKMNLFTGLLIFLLITAPWYLLAQRATPEFFHFFFVTQQVSRFLTTQEFNSKAAAWFYIPIVIGGFFPWSMFLVQAVARNIRQVWQDRQQHATELFLLLWFFIIFIFFSVPRSKTVGYILPIFPTCALLVGNYISAYWEQAKVTGLRVAIILFMGLCLALSAFIFASSYWTAALGTPDALIPYLHYIAVTLLTAAFVSCLFFHKESFAPLFSTLTAAMAVMLLIFIKSAFAINEKSIKPLVMDLKPRLNANAEVVAYYRYYHDLPIYLGRRVTVVADWNAPDIADRDNWLREMWYGMAFQDTKKWLIEDDTFWKRWNSDKLMYVVTDERYYEQLAKKTTVYKISQLKDVYLLSNKPDAAPV